MKKTTTKKTVDLGESYFMVGLSIQTCSGNETCVIIAAGLQQNQITGKGLIFLHLHNISNLIKSNQTSLVNTFHRLLLSTFYY